MCLCVMELGSLGGRTTAVMRDLRIYNTFCTACARGCSQRAAVEEDAIREQQLKWMQEGSRS